MSWIRNDIEFSSFYSYRMPNLSPSYAVASIIPSPASLRLAIVDAAIKSTGSVAYGEEIFNLIKSSPLEIEPPERVSVLKFFMKRLKKAKSSDSSFEESFGVREYCHFLGALKVFMEVQERMDEIVHLFSILRRLGTTDSIATCRATVSDDEPDQSLISRELSSTKPEASNIVRRPVSTLNELREDATFPQVNPYFKGRKGNPFIQKVFILPLVEERRGENWVIYKKVPFTI